MAKRAWYLKPGVAFKRFWADLNYVERRRYMAQRTVPTRWAWKSINRALEQIYSQPVISDLIYSNNQFVSLVFRHRPWLEMAVNDNLTPGKANPVSGEINKIKQRAIEGQLQPKYVAQTTKEGL